MLPILMIRPQRCLSIAGITLWMQRYAEVRLVLRTESQSARFMRMTSWSRVMPALLTRMSTLPNCAIACLMPDLTWSSSATSMEKAAALPPALVTWATSSSSFGWLRAATATVAPSRARESAQACPMPCDAPVTSATRPANLMGAPSWLRIEIITALRRIAACYEARSKSLPRGSHLRVRYQNLQKVVNQTDKQLASLETYANEVSMVYGIKQKLEGPSDIAAQGKLIPSFAESVQDYDFLRSTNALTLLSSPARRIQIGRAPCRE